MPLSNYPHGFRHGVSIRGMPVLNTYAGNVFHVDSGHANAADDAGTNGTENLPFNTIDYAVGRCTANNGDIILVHPGHTETVSAAAGIDLDVAGITVIGLGNGSDRPTISFTATGSDIDVDAANITVDGLYFDVTGVDAVVGALDVNSADCTIRNCEVLMADSGGQAVEFAVLATAANRFRFIGNVVRAPNAGANNAVSIEGTCDGVEIAYNHIYGDFADACIHNPTANVATNVNIHHNYLQNDQTGDHAIELVSAVTGVIADNTLVTDAIATAADLGACFSSGNMFYDSSNADAAATPYPEVVTTGGHSLSQIADRIGSEADTDALAAALYGAAGIATFPAAAAPANAVSMAEVLRSIYDRQLGDGTNAATNTRLGKRVSKTAATLPASTTQDIFTVSGGRVLVTLLTGEVTTVVQAQACNLSVVHVTTVGGDVTLASTVEINADEVGTLYGVEGDGTALVATSSGAFLNGLSGGGFVLAEGTMNITTSATNTGATSWELWYIPLDDGATVASA